MDVASLLTLLLLALVLALQPWSVVAAIVLVTSARGVVKEVAYVAGWTAALLIVAGVTLAMQPDVPLTGSSTGAVLAWVEVVSGVVLAGWLLWRFRGRAGRAAGREGGGEPRWMARVDAMPPAAAFVLGAFLPNYVVVVAAVGELLRSGESGAALAWAALGFVLVASLGVAAPLLVLVRRGDQAPAVYARWRGWLVANGGLVLTAVGLLVAVVLVGKGVVALVTG